jgi:hypothetical protein
VPAERFFLPDVANTITPISPAFAAWDVTTSATRGPGLAAKEAGGTSTILAGTGTANQNRLHRQIILGPFAAQDVNVLFKGIIRTREDNALVDARAQCVLRAIALDGSTVLATPINFDNSALAQEFGIAFAVHRFPLAYPSGGAAVVASLKQPFYWAIELGHRNHATDVNTVRLVWQGGIGTDLSETEGDVTAGDGWLEFSETLPRYSPKVKPIHMDVGIGLA